MLAGETSNQSSATRRGFAPPFTGLPGCVLVPFACHGPLPCSQGDMESRDNIDELTALFNPCR
jgi:hypothetical protein